MPSGWVIVSPDDPFPHYPMLASRVASAVTKEKHSCGGDSNNFAVGTSNVRGDKASPMSVYCFGDNVLLIFLPVEGTQFRCEFELLRASALRDVA